MSTIHDKLDQNADIIFGTTTDKTLENDEIKVTIIATGFDSKMKIENKMNFLMKKVNKSSSYR